MNEAPQSPDAAFTAGTAPTYETVLGILDEVMDPEVPVLSVVELGIVRRVDVEKDGITITVTPTYSGCPAMRAMEEDMRSALEARGIRGVRFETVYAPAWTSDWIGEKAREKLRRFGIAPPGTAQERAMRGSSGTGPPGGPSDLLPLTLRPHSPVECPYCGSRDTVLRSEFGSTACKAIHFCNSCQQPFDEFKTF